MKLIFVILLFNLALVASLTCHNCTFVSGIHSSCERTCDASLDQICAWYTFDFIDDSVEASDTLREVTVETCADFKVCEMVNDDIGGTPENCRICNSDHCNVGTTVSVSVSLFWLIASWVLITVNV